MGEGAADVGAVSMAAAISTRFAVNASASRVSGSPSSMARARSAISVVAARSMLDQPLVAQRFGQPTPIKILPSQIECLDDGGRLDFADQVLGQDAQVVTAVGEKEMIGHRPEDHRDDGVQRGIRLQLREAPRPVGVDDRGVPLEDGSQQTFATTEVIVQRRGIALPGQLIQLAQPGLLDPFTGEEVLPGADESGFGVGHGSDRSDSINRMH